MIIIKLLYGMARRYNDHDVALAKLNADTGFMLLSVIEYGGY